MIIGNVILISFAVMAVYGGTFLNLQTCFQPEWVPDNLMEQVFSWVHYVNTHQRIRKLVIVFAPIFAALFIAELAIVSAVMAVIITGWLVKAFLNMPDPEQMSSMASRELGERAERKRR